MKYLAVKQNRMFRSLCSLPLGICFLFAGCALFPAGAAAQSGSRVVANMTGLLSNKGVCRVCLFSSEASFKGKGTPFRCLSVPVAQKSARAVFEDLPAGTYAVSVFHDVNSNNRLDKNFMGIPKEGYGASRNRLPFAAAPTFADNKFELPAGATTTLSIRLRHL
jgi:uncharacterized protein (DUF2141 family)